MNVDDVVYTDDLGDVTAEQLTGGFFVGWPNAPSPAMHLEQLRGSDHVWLALDSMTGNVVGFITAISDGVLSAYIPLLEVLPEYQSHGIGAELTRRMLDGLQNVYMVDLLCDSDLQPFYARHGMRPATGMMIRNYDRQSGG